MNFYSDDFDSGSFHYGLGHIVDMDEIKKYPMKRNFRLAASDIPESFDAREKFKYCKEMFNDIRNQGECGSCYVSYVKIKNSKLKVLFYRL